MKSASLALACALLGATALAPASFAQTSTGTAQTPAEASPSTVSPDTTARTGTQAQREWRDQEGRTGGWSRSRDDDDERFSSRDMRGGRYMNHDDDDDDEDEGDMPDARGAGGAGGGMGQMRERMQQGMQQGMGQQMGQGMARRLNPDMMRMHMRMMGAQAGGARLSLKRGDSQIGIRCPANENIAACVDAVGKLMDRLQAMPQTPR
ncbi:MAG: hypothetical protein JWO64_928 [Hyphomicrobiales bacterium]|jgi:hypothetical protein|nr:hypothetical protein [Hyphomicrobiales bacterium]